MNYSGYVYDIVIIESNTYYCVLFSSRARISFGLGRGGLGRLAA